MEVTKATEIVANNVKGMIDILVETVKRLEEGQLILQEGRVDRLKKCNAELRAALVKTSSSIHLAVDADVGDDQGQGNSTVEGIEACCTSGISLSWDDRSGLEDISTTAANETNALHPILIPEILQMILRKLDKKSLYGIRLVSKKLNEAAIDVVFKQYPQHIQLSESEFKTGRVLEDLSGLHSLMRNSDAPGVLMQSLYSSGSRLMKVECLSILQEFGWALKMLEIENCDVQFSLMQSILLDWCPNLKELNLEYFQPPNTPEDFDFRSLELNLKTSQLQRLSIYSEECSSAWNPQFLTSIFKLSPNLKSFKIRGYDFNVAIQLMMQLKNFPEITNKFEELWINYTVHFDADEEANINIFTLLLDFELGPNLRTLTFEAYQRFKYDAISRLINKLASRLETIILLDRGDIEDDEPVYEISWKTALPKMPMLRVFKCMADDNYHLKSIDFLEYMPNLERFILARNKDEDELTAGRVDALFLNSVAFKPHNLKELILLGAMNSDLTSRSISQKLPNLAKLFVALDHVTQFREGKASEEWFENVFEGLEQMKNLQTLYVDFGKFQWNYDVKLETAFEKLGNLKRLRYLIFINGEGVAGSNFVSALKSLLSKADKLQCLRLIKFKMLLSDSMNLANWLGKRRTTTRLEFSDKDPQADLVSS